MTRGPHGEPTLSTLAAVREGFTSPWQGFLYLNRHPRLWRYGVVPIFLNLLLTLVFLACLVAAAVAFAVYLHPRFAEYEWGLLWEILAALGLLVLVLAAGAAWWILLGGILFQRAYEQLARHVEIQLGTPADDLKELAFVPQAVEAIRDSLAILAINLGLALSACVPVVGPVIGLPAALWFDCYLFGRNYLDLPLSLRGMRRVERLAFARRHRPHVIGLGAAALLGNLIPVFGAVLLTTAAVGAVLLHRRLTSGAAGPGDARSR